MICASKYENTEMDAKSCVRAGQIDLVFASIPFSIKAILTVAILLATIQWDVISHQAIISWLTLIFLVSVIRLWQYRQYRKTGLSPETMESWYRHVLLGAVLSGFTWGAAGLLLFPDDSMPHQLFLSLLVAGIAAGAVTTLSALLPAIMLFLLLGIPPLAWRLFSLDSELGQLTGGLLIFFMLLIMQSAHRLNSMVVATLAMRHQKRVTEAAIHRQAYHDELTDLPNRRMFLEHLDQEIARSRRHGYLEALLFLDLDNFKNVNDSLGHAVGDELLKQVATRLSRRLRKEDTVARLGGDEFVILLSEISKDSASASAWCQLFAAEIQQLFLEPFQLAGHRLHLTASIGIVLFPLDESGPGDLLQRADVAMYRAKDSGRDNFRFFQPAMQTALDTRLTIEKGLRAALQTDQLELLYQPQFDADSEIIGAEALVRWNHPTQGVVSPADFIPIAEDTGLIYQLGDWVLCAACEHIRRLSGASQLILSVNISPKQFREPAFVERVGEVVKDYGIDPKLLHLEITESTVLDNVEQTIERMESLRTLGINFSIDDFGTGHSSLAYLKRLPIEIIKIDRSFVCDIENDPNDAVLVETIIVMARHLGLDVIAEGVETPEALEFLKEKGCRKFQGYLFSRPVTFSALQEMVISPLSARPTSTKLVRQSG